MGNLVSRRGGGAGFGRWGDSRGCCEEPDVCDFMFCQALKTLEGSAVFFLLVGAGLGKLVKRSAPEEPDVVLRQEAVGFGVRLGGGG